MTNTKTDSDSIAELVRQLFLIRQNLSVAVPGAGLMETPDVDEATAFLVHPGVRAYVNGEQRTWFDKYNDYIYLGLFLGSGVGSVAAGMFGWMRGGGSAGPPAAAAAADRARVRRGARCQDAASSSMRPSARRTRCSVRYSRSGSMGKLSGDAIASFNLALADLRGRIAARRGALRTG